MNRERRAVLTTVAGMLTAGCLASEDGDGTNRSPTPTDGGGTPSPTPTDGGGTPSPTPTDIATETPPPETPSGPFVRYLVYNDDDETHPLDVTIENAAGEIVHRRSDAEFAPGEQLGATSSGYDPEQGPFPITFSLESVADTLEWTVEECPRFDILVAVTADGPLEIERELCIK